MMKQFSLWVLMAMVLVTSPSYAKKIYKSIDANGNTVFSDEPTQDSQEVELPPVQTYSAPKSYQLSEENKPDENKDQTAVEYQVSIIKPEQKYTVQMGEQSLQVELSIDPELLENHKVQILLDEQPIGEPAHSTSFTLNPLYRGTHKLQAIVLNEQGVPIQESQVVTFYVHRAKASDN